MMADQTCRSLVQALSILGKANADVVLSILESQRVIRDGRIDARLVEPALRSIFGSGSQVLLSAIRSST